MTVQLEYYLFIHIMSFFLIKQENQVSTKMSQTKKSTKINKQMSIALVSS